MALTHKQKVIADLRGRAQELCKFRNFDLDGGLRQLTSKEPTAKEFEMIKRAVDFGRAQASRDYANWLESKTIPADRFLTDK